MSPARLIRLFGWVVAAMPGAVLAGEGQLASINVDVTLHRKHQACIADIHDAAGRITAIRLTPSVGEPAWLDGLVTYWYWDGSETPFIVCSVKQLLGLLDADGTPRGLPELHFSRGFRILAECATGKGGKLQGTILYEAASGAVPSRRTRFDPDLGITSPQSVETVSTSPPAVRRGRGERDGET